jgi:DNA-binding response OmpR family regulator
MKRILVVEDDREIADLVALHLSDAGWEVAWAADGAAAMRALREGAGPDLLVLDRMLPDGDGLEICRRLRAEGSGVPVLMLTARADEVDRVVGLEVGADDYLTKPFSVPELVARVRALFRRADGFGIAPGEAGEQPVAAAGLHIDPAKRTVRAAGRDIELTAREFDLLLYLARHPGRVFTRSQLLDAVWGYTHQGYEHTVNSHINRLRAKLEPDSANPRYVITVWGVGYKFPDREAWD